MKCFPGSDERGFQFQDILQFSSVTSDFSTKSVSGGITWGLPIAETQTLQLGFAYQQSEILMGQFSSQQARQWVLQNGETFLLFEGSGGLFGTRIESVDFVAGWIFHAA